MIPQIINYCWFGKNPLDDKAKICIESWKKNLPGWQIKEWNEDNFDIGFNKYVEEAYKAKKWAFVSDVARLVIIERVGGLYFDTDVELLKTIDDLIEQGPFLGVETAKPEIKVNPGLVIAAEPHNPIINAILNSYKNDKFSFNGGNNSKYTIVERTTKILKEKYGLQDIDSVQDLGLIRIYPQEYFCPMDYATGVLNITENTRAVHWYNSSWLSKEQRKRQRFTQQINKKLPRCISMPFTFCVIKIGALIDILKYKGIKGLLQRINRSDI